MNDENYTYSNQTRSNQLCILKGAIGAKKKLAGHNQRHQVS
jgi:hypothetical protein